MSMAAELTHIRLGVCHVDGGFLAVDTSRMAQRSFGGLAEMRFVQSVFEIRYPKAHKYWDESGKLVETLEQRLPGLRCLGLEQQGFRFSGIPNRGLTNALFYWDKATVTVVEPGETHMPKTFASDAAEFVRLVGQQLSIQTLSFVGNRIWHVIPFPTANDAQQWLSRLRLWNFAGAGEALGAVDNEALRLRTRLDDRMAVLRLGSGEIGTVGGAKVTGVIVDMDLQLTDPPQMGRLDGEGILKKNARLGEQFVTAFFSQA